MNQGRLFHGPARDRFDLCFSTLVTRRELLAGKAPGGLLEGKLVVVRSSSSGKLLSARHRQPTRNTEYLASDECSVLAGEKTDCARQIGWRANAPKRNRTAGRFLQFFRIAGGRDEIAQQLRI